MGDSESSKEESTEESSSEEESESEEDEEYDSEDYEDESESEEDSEEDSEESSEESSSEEETPVKKPVIHLSAVKQQEIEKLKVQRNRAASRVVTPRGVVQAPKKDEAIRVAKAQNVVRKRVV